MNEALQFSLALEQVDQYESCIVTESVRHGVPVGVRVVDEDGRDLWAPGAGDTQPQPAPAA